MKYSILFALVFLPQFFIISCKLNQDNQIIKGEETQEHLDDGHEKQAIIEFDEDFHDFGTIKHGEVVSYSFSFKNVGNSPLIVMNVVAGCGCTHTKVNPDVIHPTEKANIEVIFDSKGWYGSQFKTVTLITNAQTPRRSVTIKANVIN